MGPIDGSNTVRVGTASGVVKARTFKRLPPGERWTGSLLDEAQGSKSTPNALEDDGGRVGISAPVLQPHAAIPLPPLVPEFRQAPRAQLRKTDFEQFGYTDNCPGCANARAGRKQAVDHSEQCRARVERILETATEGHERLERARDRFAQAAKEPGVADPSARDIALRAKRGSLLRHQYHIPARKGVAVPVLRYHHRHRQRHRANAKRDLQQATEMTDAKVEQQGESKRRREHPEVPQASNSSSESSSSSSSSTDT